MPDVTTLPEVHRLSGTIASAGFASGDRFVIGAWQQGPVGPMNDVMWAEDSNKRTLIAPDEHAARFIAAVYNFDDTTVDAVEVTHGSDYMHVRTARLDLRLQLGRAAPIPLGSLRPLWFTRHIEGPIARAMFGVRTYGRTVSGVEEWYCADAYRRIVGATASLDGVDLGPMQARTRPLAVGFSEAPPRPSAVRIRPALRDPSRRLDTIVDEVRSLR